jgi:hypothetical protein
MISARIGNESTVTFEPFNEKLNDEQLCVGLVFSTNSKATENEPHSPSVSVC